MDDVVGDYAERGFADLMKVYAIQHEFVIENTGNEKGSYGCLQPDRTAYDANRTQWYGKPKTVTHFKFRCLYPALNQRKWPETNRESDY